MPTLCQIFPDCNVPGHCLTVAAGGLREVTSELAVPIRGRGQAKWRTQFPVPLVSIASRRLTETAFGDPQVLVVGLSKMPDPQRLHDQRLSAHQPLEARGGRQADAVAARSDAKAGRLRCQSVEHTFGTLKSCMGVMHFLTKTLPRVRTETSLQVLAYNLKRMIQILGVRPSIAAMRA